MKLLKVLLLTSVFSFANCSYLNDKLISKSEKQEKIDSSESEIVTETERVYIKDEDKEKKEKLENTLRGDTQFEDDQEYPNLANVPDRPEAPISIEDQEEIVRNLEKDTFPQLEANPSLPIVEDTVPTLENEFNSVDVENETQRNYKSKKSYEETNQSIRTILSNKLNENQTYKSTPSVSKKENILDEQEQELHKLSRALKNIETPQQVEEIEEKIKENDEYYTPGDIEDILGIQGLDAGYRNNDAIDKNKPIKTAKLNNNETNIIDSEKIKKNQSIEITEVPIARITFNHGSSRLTDIDVEKIKKVVKLFNENEGKKIQIVGHAISRTNYDMDLTKHALVNFNISLERARKVMAQFSSIGFNSQKIELVAMSDSKPLYAEIMPSLEAANRRAEIFIQY